MTVMDELRKLLEEERKLNEGDQSYLDDYEKGVKDGKLDLIESIENIFKKRAERNFKGV